MSEPEAQTRDRNTHFVFDHKVFSVEGSYFAAPDGLQDPKFYLPMGNLVAAVPFHSLCSEFHIEPESDDGRLLELVSRSLKFVRAIRPNESIPKEVLDGSASWSVEEHHEAIAHGRVTAQLISMMSGGDFDASDMSQLEAADADPELKARLDKAFEEAAEMLGLGREHKQEVVNWIEHLARELSYIEALKEHFGNIKGIAARLKALAKVYSKSQISGDIDRARVLISKPLDHYNEQFDLIEQQTSDILTVLKDVERYIAVIRTTRDELHFSFMNWDGLIEKWRDLQLARGDSAEDLIRITYRFLATNFQQSRDW